MNTYTTTTVTVDTIGRAALSVRFNVQKEPVPLLDALLKEVAYVHFNLEPTKRFNRCGLPGTGEQFPTKGIMLFAASTSCHRNAAFWPEPGKFVLDSWMVPDGHRPHSVMNAYPTVPSKWAQGNASGKSWPALNCDSPMPRRPENSTFRPSIQRMR
jgi:hypothetical protein